MASNVRALRRREAAPRAGIYIRLDGHSGIAAEQYEEECRALADAHGWTVAHVYVDNDLSAYAQRTRKNYERMLRDIRSGALQAVATPHVDQLVRRKPELEQIITLCDENEVEMATVTGEIDLSTDGGRSFARQLGAFARHEAEYRAESQTRRHRDDADRGQVWRQGIRCYGYEPDGVTVVEDEARVIRDVTKRVIRGESLRQICLALNAAGHETTRGKQWHPTALRRLITNPRITGKRAYGGKLTDGEWPAIISPTEQEQVSAVLDERTAVHGRSTASPRRYLLTGGLLICGLCGSALSSQPSAASKRGYVCRKGGGLPGCGRIRIAADPVEAEATERVLARIASPSIRRRLAAMLHADDDFGGERILEQITVEEARLAELGLDYADRKIGRTEFHAARDRLQQRIDDLRAHAAGAARMRSLPGLDPESLAAWWMDASLPQRRDLVSLVLDHIVVGKATRHGPVGLDDDRLSWVWRAE